MQAPTPNDFTPYLPDWTITGHIGRVSFTSPCGRVKATVTMENLVFGKGRRAKRVTEWVLRKQGKPGFNSIGNADVDYFVRALRQAVQSADARERNAEAKRLADIEKRKNDVAAIFGVLTSCGFGHEVKAMTGTK